MFLLTDLTLEGYIQIKKDREIIARKVKELNSIIYELDLALPFLTAIYEPKIIIRKILDKTYQALTIIPYNGEKIRISVVLSEYESSRFVDDEDPELMELLEKLIKAKIKQNFPDNFKDTPHKFNKNEGEY
jgi:hypothetical protein